MGYKVTEVYYFSMGHLENEERPSLPPRSGQLIDAQWPWKGRQSAPHPVHYWRFSDDFPTPAPDYGSPPGFILTNLGRLQQGISDIIIQIDGSWDANTGFGGASLVVTQNMHHLHRQGVFLYASSALYSEVVACLYAIKWVRTTRYSNVLITTDSVLLVRYLESKKTTYITMRHTLNAVREEASTLQWCRIMKVSRDQVHQAHTIATSYRTNRFNLD